jgi:SWI/SNF-related matrix-associated actin-dependent regulator 1 of chromatin subfamily A
MLVIVNKFPGRCKGCSTAVGTGEGFAVKNGRWETYCRSSQCLPPEAQDTVKTKQVVGPGTRELRADGTIHMGYEPDALPLLRAMPGAKFDRPTNAWHVSLTAQDRMRVLELAEKLRLTVAPELLVVEKPTASREAGERAKAGGAYGYQVDGAEWLACRDKALLGDDMGLGKTPEVLWAFPTDVRALIVCPASLKWNWHDECRKFRPDLKPVVCSGKNGFRFPSADGEVLIANPDILPAYLAADTGEKDRRGKVVKAANLTDEQKALAALTILVVDEAQIVKNYQAARSAKVLELRKACAKTWFLTGTPLMNRPFDLWGVLNAGGMAQDVFGGFNRFVSLFGGCKNGWGGYEWGMPSSEVPERLRRVMLRRTKGEVLKDLPPKRFQTLRVNGLSTETRERLDALMEEWGEVVTAGALPGFEEFSAIRAMLAAERIPAVLELVESYEDAEAPLVVFSAHRAPVEALAQREGWRAILGGTTAEARREIVRDFQAGKLKGIALTIAAGSTGLTLTRASTVLFVDLDWTPAQNIQAEDRVHRISQAATSVHIIHMVGDHPLDQHVVDLLQWKMQLIRSAIDATASAVELKPLPSTAGFEMVEETEAEQAARRAAYEAASVGAERLAARERCGGWLERERGKGGFAAPVKLTDAQKAATLEAFGFLLGCCDGAVTQDGQGFNKPDAAIAHGALAAGLHDADQDDGLVELAYLMLRRYPGQVKGRWPVLWDREETL